MPQPFEIIKGTNATGSPRKDSSSAPRPGSINSADPSSRPTSHSSLKASHPASSAKTGATPVTAASKQSTQATGLYQQTGSHSRIATPPPLARDPSTLDPSTRATGSGDVNRRSVHSQLIGGGHNPLHDRASATPSIARSGNPPTHAVEITERGRLAQVSKAANVASSRESSSAPSEDSSAPDTSDDEDPSQSPGNQLGDSPNRAGAGRGSGGTTATGGNVQLSARRDQYTEVGSSAASPPSRESSPPLSVDISTSDSLNSGDSNRDSPSNAPPKDPRLLASSGRGDPADDVATRQFTETQEYDHYNVPGKSDVYSSTVTPHAPLASLPTSEMANSAEAGGSSASHVQPTELLSLTNLGIGGPAATESAKYLAQAVGRDVMSFRRNTHVSYMVTERARDIINAINEYIARVEDSEFADWDSFEKFTVAIEPLEDILFTLLAFTEDEKARYLASTNSIDDCISSAETWAHNREGLSSALDGFDTRQELVVLFDEPDTSSRKSEHREAQIYDDRTLLEEIRNTIHTFILEDSTRFPSYIKDVQTSLNRLQNKVIDEAPADWLTVITIKTSMLVEGVVEMVKAATLGSDTLDHLRSRPVWKAASALIEFLEDTDERQPTLPPSAETKYDGFVETLRKLGKLVVPRTFMDLMKQAGRIRRPYQAQAIALIGLCRFLEDKFSTLGDSVLTVENVNALEDAFDKALVALQTAAKAVTALRAFNLTNFDTDDTVLAFGEAEVLIRDIFRSVNLEDEWIKKQSDLIAAFNKDKERMEKLNNMLNSPQSHSFATEKVTVNVSIRDKSPEGRVLGDTSVEEEISTRLLALRWRVASVLKQEEIKRARTSGTFYKWTVDGRSEVLASHSTLGEIAGDSSAVTLKFVVP